MSALCFPFYKLLLKDDVKSNIITKIKDIQYHSEWLNFNLCIDVADIDLSTINYEDTLQQMSIWRDIAKLSVDLWRDYDYYSNFVFETRFNNKDYIRRLETLGFVFNGGTWRSKSKPEEEVVQANIFIYCLYQLIFNEMNRVRNADDDMNMSDSNIGHQKKNFSKNSSNIGNEKIKPCHVIICKNMFEFDTIKQESNEIIESMSVNNLGHDNKIKEHRTRKSKIALNCCIKTGVQQSLSNKAITRRKVKDQIDNSSLFLLRKRITKQHSWKCRTCNFINDFSADNCVKCGEIYSGCMWICIDCTKLNKSNSYWCKSCGASNMHKECPLRIQKNNVNTSDSNIEHEKYKLNKIKPCHVLLYKNEFDAETMIRVSNETAETMPIDNTVHKIKGRESRTRKSKTLALNRYIKTGPVQNIKNSRNTRNRLINQRRISNLFLLRRRLEKEHNWKCRNCDSINDYKSDNCVTCGGIYNRCIWICLDCTQWNKSKSSRCKSCGAINKRKECAL